MVEVTSLRRWLMLNLQDRDWQAFLITNLGEMNHGKRLTIEARKSGNIPLMTAGFGNYGIGDFISNADWKTYKNAVTVDMFCNSFYKSCSVTGDDNIYFFTDKRINKYSGIFLSVCIEKQKTVYSYGKQVREKVLKRFKVLLPVNQDGFPDWQFMEEYVKEREQLLINQYRDYIQREIDILENSMGGGQLNS